MKKRISKRFLSMLLVLVMVLSTLPMTAMAADFNVGGVDVSVGFGKEVNPNALTDANGKAYDIGAVGAVKLTVTGTGKDAKLNATGEIELRVPREMFDTLIAEKAEEMVKTNYDAKLDAELGKARSVTKTVTKTVTTYVDVTYMGQTVEDVEVTVPVTVSQTITGTPAEIVDTLLNGKEQTIRVKQSGTQTVILEEYGNVEVTVEYSVDQDVTVVYREEIDPEATLLEIAKTVLDGWYGEYDEEYFMPAWAAATLAAYDAAAADNKLDVAEAQVKQLASVYAAYYINKNAPIPSVSIPGADICDEDNGEYRSADHIRKALKDAVVKRANDVLEDHLKNLYGKVGKIYSLKDKFDNFVTGVANNLGVELGAELPTGALDTLENAMKSIVASINGGDVKDVVLTRKIIGQNNEDLTEQNATGVYVVAGVNMDKTVGYEAHVIAPELVDVSILANGEDKGYFLKTTAGEEYSITSTDEMNDGNLMQLRIVGLTTDGQKYDSEYAPKDAGVYTVLSIYLNKETLAMGADVAVLVVEPKDTPTSDFKFTKAEVTETYKEGVSYFPAITNNLGHLEIKGAVKGNEAFVILPENYGDIVSSVEDQAADILKRLNEKAEGLHLPTTGLTNYLLHALAVLADEAAKVEGNTVTGAEAKAYLAEYLKALKDWYSANNVKSMAAEVYYNTKSTIAQNETVKHYKSTIESVLKQFQSFAPMTATIDETATTYGSAETEILQEFLDVFLEKTGVTKANVAATVRSVMDYAVEYATNTKYYDDAVALVTTMGKIAGADSATVDATVADVKGVYDTMVADVKTIVKGIDVDDLNEKAAKDLANELLLVIETFVKDTMALAETFVEDTNWKVNTIYFDKKPSEVGVYDCYAINVNPSYIPNLATATLIIEEPVAEPVTVTITPVHLSLNLESEVHINADAKIVASDWDRVVEIGLLTWYTRTDNANDATIANADVVTPGCTLLDNGYYRVRSQGIPAKNMADDVWYKVYVMLDDGSYVYSARMKYSPKMYSNTILGDDSYSDEMKALCVALMNYGAEAQTFFADKGEYTIPTVNGVETLMNADISAEDQARVKAFDATMLDERLTTDSSKHGEFTTSSLYKTYSMFLSLEGAITLNYNILHNAPAGSVTDCGMLIWTEEDYAEATTLTWENASAQIDGVISDGCFTTAYTGNAAKNMGDTVYACAYMEVDGEYHYIVFRSSVDFFVQKIIDSDTQTELMKSLAQHLAVYGEYAAAYFASK